MTDPATRIYPTLRCVDLIAMGEGIDLDAAIAAKFNATSEKVGLATRQAVDDFADIDTAPYDGSLFIGCNLDHPSFGSWPMYRRVRHIFDDQGHPQTVDLGGWVILHDLQHDPDGHDVGPDPIAVIASDHLNTTVRYGWRPMPQQTRPVSNG